MNLVLTNTTDEHNVSLHTSKDSMCVKMQKRKKKICKIKLELQITWFCVESIACVLNVQSSNTLQIQKTGCTVQGKQAYRTEK